MEPLKPADFPLAIRDQHLCRSDGVALLGPLPDGVACDLAERLNRDAAVQAGTGDEQPEREPGKVMFVGPSLGPYPCGPNG